MSQSLDPVELRETIAWPFADGAPSFAARVRVPRVALFPSAGAPVPRHHLDHPIAGDLPLVFLVLARHGEWLQVQVPLRPNGTTAWIRLHDVAITQTQYQVDVVLDARRLILRWDRRPVLNSPVAVGRPHTPTPIGNFYVDSSIKREVADPLYGTYALGLSGFSEVLFDFRGGTGQLGIHGTGRPDLIGRAVTAGCIRLRDDDARELSRRVPLGTPVRIR